MFEERKVSSGTDRIRVRLFIMFALLCVLSAVLPLSVEAAVVDGRTREGDSNSPSVNITLPVPYNKYLDNTLTTSSIEVTGNASSPRGIQKVEVRVNNGTWHLASGTFNWDSTVPLPEGLCHIEARITDMTGDAEAAALTVKVDHTPPPAVSNLTVEVGIVSGEVRLKWDRWEEYDYENGTEPESPERHSLVIYVSTDRPDSLEDMTVYEKWLGLEDWESESHRLPWIYERDVSNLRNGKKYWLAVVAVDSYGNENGTLLEDGNLVWAIPVSPPDALNICMTYLMPAFIILVVLILAYSLAPGGRMRKLRARLKDTLRPYVYVAPAVIALMVLTFYPVGYGFYISFTNMDAKHLFTHDIIGFENYAAILGDTDAGFRDITLNTFAWTFSNVFITMGIGLGLALVLNRKGLRGKVAYRTFLLLPWAVPAYISCLIWRGMFNPQFGAINHFITTLGMDPIPWLTEMPYAFWACIITNVWLGVPFMVMIFSGGLQSIPEDLYEAASTDGVSGWQQFRNITLPLLKPTVIPAFLLSFIWTFNMFNVIYLITGGGPGGQTDILITYVYKEAFRHYNYGFAAAYSVIIFFMLLSFSMVYMKISKSSEGDR